MKESGDIDESLAAFDRVLELEEEKGEWGFKALKQKTKVNFKHKRHGAMLESYKTLLGYIKSSVTRNYSERSINSILDYISASKNMKLLKEFYGLTLESLKIAKNDRLWFKTNTKLASLYLQNHDWNSLLVILKVSLQNIKLLNSFSAIETKLSNRIGRRRPEKGNTAARNHPDRYSNEHASKRQQATKVSLRKK